MTPVILALALLVAPASATAPARSQASPPIGYVVSMQGAWTVDGAPVAPGQGLRAGAQLRLSASSSDGTSDSIDVMLLNNRALGCHTTPACRPGVTLPASLNAPAPVAARLASVFNLIFSKPTRWAGLVSRGLPTAFDLRDAVLSDSDGLLWLGTLLSRMPEGDYVFRLANQSDDKTGSRPTVLNLKWAGAPPQTVATPIAPGLYSLEVTKRGNPEVLGRDTWLLIVPPDRFDDLRAAFGEAAAAAATWKDMPGNDVDRFLHAFLASLAHTLK